MSMGYIDLLNIIKKMPENSGDDESNSLWTVYYGQYLYALWAILDACDKKYNVDYEEVFLPLCFLVSHYMELWGKTISKNFGIGDFEQDAATLVSGHHVDELLERLDKRFTDNEQVHQKIQRITELYKSLQGLTMDNTPVSEAMRYPINKKDKPTLSQSLSTALEWQDFSFDFSHYGAIIQNLISETEDIYDLIFQEKIH